MLLLRRLQGQGIPPLQKSFLAINNLTEKAEIDLWLNEMEKYANESKAIIISFRPQAMAIPTIPNPKWHQEVGLERGFQILFQ